MNESGLSGRVAEAGLEFDTLALARQQARGGGSGVKGGYSREEDRRGTRRDLVPRSPLSAATKRRPSHLFLVRF